MGITGLQSYPQTAWFALRVGACGPYHFPFPRPFLSANHSIEMPRLGHALQLVDAGVLEREHRSRHHVADRLGDPHLFGFASELMRAPMWTAIPRTASPSNSTSPVWTPARISNPNSRTRSTIAVAHRSASLGLAKVARKPSPAVSISRP
jgi:hypothetical protein